MATNRVYDIIHFGAIPDGVTLCTRAFAAAIEAAAGAGGGVVTVPAGTFLSGPIRLASNITLHLENGAKVAISQSAGDYPLVRMRWEGTESDCYAPQIFGSGLENVAVTGQGELDGQGDYWWRLHREGTLAHPRPRLISFVNCRNVLIEGLTLRNSPSWTINPILCEDVAVDGVTITNPADSPNTDGIDPESCREVRITNCLIDVGDDCIAIKSGKEDCFPRVPCENITITGCTMLHGHGGVVIGSEMSGGVRNVSIAGCTFDGTDRGIRIKSRRGRGGVVEDVTVRDIVMRGVICPIVMHMYYFCGAGGKEETVWDKEPHPVTNATPVFRRIHLSEIHAREVAAAGCFIYGLPEMPIEEVTFEHVLVEMARDATPAVPAMMSGLEPMVGQGFLCNNVRRVTFDDVSVIGHRGPPTFRLEHAEDVEVRSCSAEGAEPDQPLILQV